MKSLIFIALALVLSLKAQENLAKYDISMKMLGAIGKSSLTLHTNDNTYEMKMHLQMEESLSDVEHSYESYGSIVDGVYRPDKFIKYIREGDNDVTNYYIFDYEKQQIQKYTTTKEVKSGLLGLFASKDPVITETFETMKSFTPNDTLTTFLNAELLLDGKSEIAVNSVGFRKNEREIALYRDADAYRVTVIDKQEREDYSIVVSIAPDGLISKIQIKEFTLLGTIDVARN